MPRVRWVRRKLEIAGLAAELTAARDDLASATAQLAGSESQVGAKTARIAELETDLQMAAARVGKCRDLRWMRRKLELWPWRRI